MALLLTLAANYQLREPVYAVRINVDWRQGFTLNLLQSTLTPINFPAGEQVYDRPGLGPIQPLRSWTWNYNLNLIGQDALPFRQQDWPIYRPLPWVPAGFTQSSPIALTPSLNVPFRQQDWPNPYGPLQPLRSWTWQYNLNLIGQDALPVGEQVYNLPPIGYIYPNQLRTWVQALNLALSTVAQVPFNQFDWPTPKGPDQPLRSWVWSYNLNLIGQDQLPVGEQVYTLPPKGYEYPNQLRTWTINLQQYTLQPLPYGKQVYDRPPYGPNQPLRGWVWNYNLNLIGQDQLPVGEQVSALPPKGYEYPNQLRTWIESIDLALFAQPLPFNQYDWPNPKAPLQPLRSWTYQYNLNLIGKDQLPVGTKVYDLPPLGAVRTPFRSWTWNYNLNLIGKDALPVGKRIIELSPIGPLQPLRSWTFSFNLNLIGKDRLPTGKQIYDRPVLSLDDGRRSWIQPHNLPLRISPAQRPFNQFDWPNPKPQPTVDHAWILATNPNLLHPTPPPPVLPNIERPWIRDYWDRDEWGNFLPGSGIRRG